MLLEAGVSGAALAIEANRIAAKVEAVFSRYLQSSGDGRDRLFEAMRNAGLGGGKRIRPCSPSPLGACSRSMRSAASCRGSDRGDPCLFADP
jgi:hypothetical protein